MRTVVTPTTAQLIVATASGAKPTYENSGNGSRWIAMRSVNRDPQRSPRGPGRGGVKVHYHLCTRHNEHERCRSKKCKWETAKYVKNCRRPR